MIGRTLARCSRGLPVPVSRYLDVALNGQPPTITTLLLEGKGHVCIGPLSRLPIDARMFHRLGADYTGLIRVRLGGLTVLPVIDAYVDGAGITKVGPAVSIGPEVDQGAFLGMWPAAVAYPSTWIDGVEWEPLDEHTGRIRLPFGDSAEIVTVHFDPDTAYPVRFEADRYKGVSGRKVRWFGDSAEWHTVDGRPVPGVIRGWWQDEPRPWFELRVESARFDVPIGEALAKARRAIAMAQRKGKKELSGGGCSLSCCWHTARSTCSVSWVQPALPIWTGSRASRPSCCPTSRSGAPS